MFNDYSWTPTAILVKAPKSAPGMTVRSPESKISQKEQYKGLSMANNFCCCCIIFPFEAYSQNNKKHNYEFHNLALVLSKF